jgi:4,5-dihydroxyphthalate decarboxylase
MPKLPLSLSCGPYEITRALIDGTVTPDGVDLTVLSRDLERIFRGERRDEVDIAEFNIMALFKHAGAGVPVRALPIFTHRRFRHGSIYLNTAAGVESPADLAGRPVVIGGYEPAAVIWIRGILEDEYGLTLDSVDWIDVFGRLGRLPDGQSEPLHTSQPGSRQQADRLLLDGTAAGMVSAYTPESFLSGDPRIRRLFPDPRSVERAYFARTRIFPVMHVITVKQALLDEHRWLAESLTAAFTDAKRVALRRLRNPRVMPLAFWQYALEEQEGLLGPDPWQYGLTEDNRSALGTALRYARQQGVCDGQVDLESLFVDVENTALETSEFV